MCTVTWWYGAGGAFSVFFNRDELRTRLSSKPVEENATVAGTRFLAPRDPVAGGTWLMANAAGVVVGVLNNYATGPHAPSASIRTRGQLPLAFADCRDRSEVAMVAQKLSVRDFAPFFLLAWDPRSVSGWIWNGLEFVVLAPLARPITTSSYRTEEVRRWRCERYAAAVSTGSRDELMAFQDDTAHPDPAFNVRMRRPDARTESLCRVDVTASEVRYHHQREASDALEALDVTTVAVERS